MANETKKNAASATARMSQVITLKVKGNPKRPGTQCHAWFEFYKNGMTVAQYHAKRGKGAAGDLRWDEKHGFIAIGAGKGKATKQDAPKPEAAPASVS